jgi:hypothetical protein
MERNRFRIERWNWKAWRVELSSGDGDEYPGCRLSIQLRHWHIRVNLPPIIKPYAEKVIASTWDAATVERLGRNWYWHYDERAYGVSLVDGHFSIHYGRRTMDSSTEQRWSCFLPWTQWRHVRTSTYGLDGRHFFTEPKGSDFRAYHAAVNATPSRTFAFRDFDGEQIEAKARIEEREWRFGEGWFRWLSLFRSPKVSRSLNLEFSAEVGPRKGSWKGGTVGHSIEMQPGELHESAFRRYCEQHKLTFIALATSANLKEPQQ